MNKNTELKVTVEKVQNAAASCPEAEKTLRNMFPEAFEKPHRLIGGISLGDVFDTRLGHERVVVLSCYKPDSWYVGGLYGQPLQAFSNFRDGASAGEIIKFLNEEKYIYIGNIMDAAGHAFKSLPKPSDD